MRGTPAAPRTAAMHRNHTTVKVPEDALRSGRHPSVAEAAGVDALSVPFRLGIGSHVDPIATRKPLYPLSPVVATPSIKCRWPMKNITIIGNVVITLAVTINSQCQLPAKPNWSTMALSPRGTVNVLESLR